MFLPVKTLLCFRWTKTECCCTCVRNRTNPGTQNLTMDWKPLKKRRSRNSHERVVHVVT